MNCTQNQNSVHSHQERQKRIGILVLKGTSGGRKWKWVGVIPFWKFFFIQVQLLGLLMKKKYKKRWFNHNLLGSFLPTSILSAREKKRQRLRTNSMRSIFLTKQILKQNYPSLKREQKMSSFLWVIFLHYLYHFNHMSGDNPFRTWIHFDSVLSLCNRQNDHKIAQYYPWSCRHRPAADSPGESHSDHSWCQKTQTGNIFRNRLYSCDAGWGLKFDCFPDSQSIKTSQLILSFSGARN